MQASYKWTTCQGTPVEETCQEGTNQLVFSSTSSDPNSIDSWGGENYPGVGLFSLPGTGTFTCESHSLARQRGHIEFAKHTKKLAVRDQAASYAASGSGIRVGTSLHPGMRGPFGANASVRLGQPNTCGFAGLPVSSERRTLVLAGQGRAGRRRCGARRPVSDEHRLADAFCAAAGIRGLRADRQAGGTVHWSLRVASFSALTR